jgi:hypothetical protein
VNPRHVTFMFVLEYVKSLQVLLSSVPQNTSVAETADVNY